MNSEWKSYKFIKRHQGYSPGRVITPTPAVADLLLKLGVVEEFIPEPVEKPKRGRPKKTVVKKPKDGDVE